MNAHEYFITFIKSNLLKFVKLSLFQIIYKCPHKDIRRRSIVYYGISAFQKRFRIIFLSRYTWNAFGLMKIWEIISSDNTCNRREVHLNKLHGTPGHRSAQFKKYNVIRKPSKMLLVFFFLENPEELLWQFILKILLKIF